MLPVTLSYLDEDILFFKSRSSPIKAIKKYNQKLRLTIFRNSKFGIVCDDMALPECLASAALIEF